MSGFFDFVWSVGTTDGLWGVLLLVTLAFGGFLMFLSWLWSHVVSVVLVLGVAVLILVDRKKVSN